MPEWLDILDVTDRIRGFVGMFAILASRRFSFGQPPRHLAARCHLGAGPAVGLRRFWCCECRPVRRLFAAAGQRRRIDPQLRARGGQVRLRRPRSSMPRGRPASSLRSGCCRRSSSSRPCSPFSTTWA